MCVNYEDQYASCEDGFFSLRRQFDTITLSITFNRKKKSQASRLYSRLFSNMHQSLFPLSTMSRDSTLMTHTSNTSFPLSSRLPLIPALYAVYHTHFRMRPHAIVQLFPTPRQAWRSQCVSIRDVIKHDRLSRWIFNILARCAHQGRPNAVTASCTCKGHLVYLLGDVTSPWRKQEIVETT